MWWVSIALDHDIEEWHPSGWLGCFDLKFLGIYTVETVQCLVFLDEKIENGVVYAQDVVEVALVVFKTFCYVDGQVSACPCSSNAIASTQSARRWKISSRWELCQEQYLPFDLGRRVVLHRLGQLFEEIQFVRSKEKVGNEGRRVGPHGDALKLLVNIFAESHVGVEEAVFQ